MKPEFDYLFIPKPNIFILYIKQKNIYKINKIIYISKNINPYVQMSYLNTKFKIN